jgi:glucose-6-phosphate 1-dehydrogenase
LTSYSYFDGSYDDKKDYENLHKQLEEIESFKQVQVVHRLFYLSLPPDIFIKAATNVGNAAKTKTGWNRIVIEKPFGRDSKVNFKKI